MPKTTRSAAVAGTFPKTRRGTRAEQDAAAGDAAEAEFNSNRITRWDALFGRALRLDVLLQEFPQCQQDNDWHFENFKTNARQMRVCFDKLTVDGDLSYEMAERLDSFLCTGQDLFNSFIAELERAQRERDELAARKNETLNLLTPDQRALLGLPNTYTA